MQTSTQPKFKAEIQLDSACIPQDISLASTVNPTEDTSVYAMAEGATVKAKGNESNIPSGVNLPQEAKNISLDKLREVAKSTDLAKLEAGVETARGILDAIRPAMDDSKQREQMDWLTAIDRLQTNSTRIRTVVAIAGSTGAGKSSLVNAILDEDRLVPTSGWRACTAVITEISYNEVNNPRMSYRGEVEFISRDDWISELRLLLDDLVEDRQLSDTHLDDKTEAGIAYAKIRAVYPDLTHDMIVESEAEELANRKYLSRILGHTRKINCRNASALYSDLRVYLDSKDKATKGGSEKMQGMAFWPLIKVVRVYTKAEALCTGVVLVDLPGIHDANAARSAIARKYMSECSAVWVAAPIKRAVDDKSAQDLLGKGSRLRLKLDGIYSNVTFICTMTDSVQLSESVEAFDQDGHIQAILSREDELDKSIQEQKNAINQQDHLISVKISEWDSIANELETWRGLEKNERNGQQVYPPRVPAKRKHSVASTRSRRHQQLAENKSDNDTDEKIPPLTTEDIAFKLTELDAKARAVDEECTAMEKKSEDLKRLLNDLQNEKRDIDGESTRLCIQKRNEHVKQAIRVDFAAGIRDIDEEDAQADEDTFDPSIKKRDYDEMSRSLPIFCISSKAFQQLRGRRKRDTQVQGFKQLVDTEIPLVQEHARRLPEKARILAYKAFLNEFCLLLNSLTIWVTNSALELDAIEMSKENQSYEMKHLHAAAQNLKKDLGLMILAQKQELCSIRQNTVDSKSTVAMAYASSAVETIATGWITRQVDGGHGLKYGTYRAICRRDGSRTRSQKSRDFNEDILEPYLTKISTGWERAFCQSIPASLDEFVDTFMMSLESFHQTMSSRPELQKCKAASLKVLEKQHQSHEENIRAMVDSIKTSIQSEQRQASRAFLPGIQKEMLKAYSQCANETGQGCFRRMREIMGNHIRENKNNIYRKASQRVKRNLDRLFETNRKNMDKAARYLVDGLENNFRMVISSSEMIDASDVARDHIRGVLHEIDSQFEKVLCMDQMDVDPAKPSQAIPQTVSATPLTQGAPPA